ncbi:MAG: hypothetical protein ABI200_03240 [Gaiellales bacterium]
MGESTIIWLAVVGGIVAFGCALVCAVASVILARAAQRGSSARMQINTQVAHRPAGGQPQPQPMMTVLHPVVAPQPQQPIIVMMPQPQLQPQPPHHPQPGAGVVLEGHYPQLGRALGSWLQVERDELERGRIARDLGRLGSADAARALLDGVRTGVITPTIAADNLERGGFDAGIAVATALRDPEPRVRALATSLVGRRVPLTPASIEPPPASPPPRSDPRA